MIPAAHREAFGEVQQHSLPKTCNNLGREGLRLNLIKSIYKKPRASIRLNGEILTVFP